MRLTHRPAIELYAMYHGSMLSSKAMAWHRIHGERFPMISDGKAFYHAKGWIEIERENTDLIELIRQLSRKLREKELPIIQGDQEGWFTKLIQHPDAQLHKNLKVRGSYPYLGVSGGIPGTFISYRVRRNGSYIDTT